MTGAPNSPSTAVSPALKECILVDREMPYIEAFRIDGRVLGT